MRYIGKHQGTKNIYLFFHVANESIGDRFNARTVQLSQHQIFQSQKQLLNQLSQNYGNMNHINQEIVNNQSASNKWPHYAFPLPLTNYNHVSQPEK